MRIRDAAGNRRQIAQVHREKRFLIEEPDPPADGESHREFGEKQNAQNDFLSADEAWAPAAPRDPDHQNREDGREQEYGEMVGTEDVKGNRMIAGGSG